MRRRRPHTHAHTHSPQTHNRIATAESCHALAALLPSTPNLHHLDLTNCGIKPAAFTPHLLPALARACPNLTHLSLRSNPLQSEGITALAAALNTPSSSSFSTPPFGSRLSHLSLDDTGLSRAGAQPLATLLHHTPALPRLHTLTLSFNVLGLYGVQALMDAVKQAEHPRHALACVELYMNGVPYAELALMRAKMTKREWVGVDEDEDEGGEKEGRKWDRVFLV